jgi:cation diffusion facilitator CzcD-associated flavoprotein CzcO
MSSTNGLRVCVIGAGGMSGLAFLAALNSPEHQSFYRSIHLRAYEQAPDIGGTWKLETEQMTIYRNKMSIQTDDLKDHLVPEIDLKPIESLALHWNSLFTPTVHSSRYESLITNLPKHVMQFSNFPYPEDVPNYPKHRQVLQYMRDYAKHKNIEPLIEFNAKVSKVTRDRDADVWTVTVKKRIDGSREIEETLEFDSLVICNGVSFTTFSFFVRYAEISLSTSRIPSFLPFQDSKKL